MDVLPLRSAASYLQCGFRGGKDDAKTGAMTRPIRLLTFLLLVCAAGGVYLLPCGYAEPDEPVFSLSCRDAGLRDVLGNLANQKGVNLAGLDVIAPSVTLTANLSVVPLESGLRALLEPRGFTLEKRGGIYFIGQDAQMARGLSLSVSEGRLTVDANRVDVNDVVRALASSGISISSASNLTGQVTAHLRSEPLESALRVLLADFTLQDLEGIYRVEPPRNLRESGLTMLITDGVVSIAAEGASLSLLLSELAARTRINLSVVGDMKRQVTLRLDNRTVSELLADLAVMTGFTYRQVDDLHFFGKPEIKPDVVNPLIERKTIWLKHLVADTVLNLLPIHIPKQNVVVSASHNTVTVVGSRQLVSEAEQFLLELDAEDDAIRGREGNGAIAVEVDRETGRLSVDLLNAPRFDAVRELSVAAGFDMVFLDGSDLQPEPSSSSGSTIQRSVPDPPPSPSTETVTLRQMGATLDSVLSALFLGSSYGYTWAESNPHAKQMLVIGSEMKAPFSESALIALNYLAVPKAMELLPAPLKVNISPLTDRSALLVTGSAARIDAFRKYLETIDVPQPQAMIQLYLLELTKGNRDELGLTVGAVDNRTSIEIKDGFGLSFDSMASVPAAFSAKLAALVEQNRGKVLANPSLAVVNGEKASIDIGGKHLFETNNPIYPTIGVGEPSTTPAVATYGGYAPSIYRSLFTIETGILLELTPVIGASGEVTMAIQLAIRNADQVSREESSLDQRLIQTTISVADRGVVVIGGLLQEKEIQEVSRVPILSRIPLLGGLLFTSKETTVEQTELIVIIQPKVIKSDESHLFTDN